MAKRRRRGVGQTITIRRMRGLGDLKNPKSFMGAALPPVLGGGLTALAVLATRYWAKPSEVTDGSETPKMLFQWAGLIGLAAGGLGSLALYYLGGAPAAISSFSSSVLVAATTMAHDMVVKDKLGDFQLAFPPTLVPSASQTGVPGFGVVVPQRLMGSGTRGIVYEPTASRDPVQRYGLGNSGYGEEVSLGAVNPRAFGTPGFGY